MNIREDIEVLIVKEFTSRLSQDEQGELSEWRATSELNEKEYGRYKQIWEKSEGIKSFLEEDAAKAWKSCSARMNFAGSNSQKPSMWIRKVAAIMIPTIMAVSSFLLYQNVPGFGHLQAFEVSKQVDSIVLKDNSSVILAQGSKIIYSKGFDEQVRKVHLEGMGYFKVARDENRPFIVNIGESEVKVLGTEFHLRESESKVELFVTHGKVQFSMGDETVILTKGQKAIASNGKVIKSEITDNNFMSWRTGELKFEGEDFSTIINEVENYFSEIKEVELLCKLPEEKVTTRFKKPTISEVVEELAIHFKKKMVVNDGKLIVSD